MIMDNKINIAELLKDCPNGMELDSTLFDDICFDCIDDVCDIIKCYIQESKHKIGISFDKYGHYSNISKSKCVIFPKGKTTWEGFTPPCQFKDGDVVVAEDAESFQLFLLKHLTHSEDDNTYDGYCYFGWNFQYNDLFEKGNWGFNRLATEEEKQKLFDAIKANGYKWNEETKTLEKLPKFKVGNRIKYIYFDRKVAKVVKIHENRYELDNGKFLDFQDENAYEISYDKFDINTLKPFDKVLVRNHNAQEWVASLFSNYNEPKKYKYICVNGSEYAQCIPYEENKHLLGTTNDCDDFYKTWE